MQEIADLTTFLPKHGSHVSVSPDGSRVAYSTCEYRRHPSPEGSGKLHLNNVLGYEIATADVSGSDRERLTANGLFDSYPTWSPDGTRIAFINTGRRDYEPFDSQIMTMSADGTDIKVVPNTEGVDVYPLVWSPDGERLAFIAHEQRRLGSGLGTLHTVRLDGSELSKIGAVSTMPAWSPDSKRLAYGFNDFIDMRSVYRGPGGVYTVQFNGTDLREVLPGFAAFDISWSPDGSELLLTADGLYLVRQDGSSLRQLYRLESSDVPYHWLIHATWSPDGSTIAAREIQIGYSWSGVSKIFIMARDGSGTRLLAEEKGEYLRGLYQPSIEPVIEPGTCSAGVVIPEPEANPGLVEDCNALAEVLGELAELESSGWGAQTPITEWSGVVVSGSPPRVRGLLLGDLGLVGFAPPSIGKLAMLEILELSANKLVGPIPVELSELRNLKELYLGSNGLAGGIPPELAEIKGLRLLDLANNYLRGAIPSELGRLENLSALHLDGNSLTGEIPVALSRMTSLRILHLRGNDLSGCVPPDLSELWVDASGFRRCAR